MPKKTRSEMALYRKRFVAKAFGLTGATEKQTAARLGITEGGVSRIAKKQGVEREFPLKTGPKGLFQLRPGKKVSRQRFAARAFGLTGLTEEEIGARIGSTARHVRRIAKQVGAVRRYPPKRGPKGLNRRRPLTADEKNRIRELRKEGWSEQKLAGLFGRTQPAIHYVLRRK